MKLYFTPGACSQAPHIVLHETGLGHEAIKVDLRAKKLEGGEDYLAINPKGAVPAIALENGEVLTENAVILQYLGDRASLGDLLPGLGDFRRYRVLEWVNYITTEVHKGFGPLFAADAGDEVKAFATANVKKKLDYVDKQLVGPFLMGDALTIADAYLFVMTGWAEKMFGMGQWPKLAGFRAAMMDREAVRATLRMEGLLKEEIAD
jgi:glutathione S-transferase